MTTRAINKNDEVVEETVSEMNEVVREKKELSAVKAALDKQKKRSIRLPKPKDEHDINYVPVCINGYTYQVKKGENVEVPETVAVLLEESGYLDA